MQDLEQRYDDWLDEVVGDVRIGSLTYSASRVLEAVDPVAYRCGFSDFLDAEGLDPDSPKCCRHAGEESFCDCCAGDCDDCREEVQA